MQHGPGFAELKVGLLYLLCTSPLTTSMIHHTLCTIHMILCINVSVGTIAFLREVYIQIIYIREGKVELF